MAFPSLPSWSSRNPLSILALFIALIYGMAALLFGVAVKTLTAWNQTILVLFLVAFPAAVLWVFAWLVAKHHAKLYSPSEYRTDAAFHNSPLSFGGRFDESAEAPTPASADTTPSSVKGEQLPPAPPPSAHAAPEPSDTRAAPPPAEPHQNMMRQALLAETLAFQELQREFDASVRRDVSVSLNNRVYRLDGIIEAEGQSYAVEVRLIRNRVSVMKRSKDISSSLQGLMMPIILAFVVDDSQVSVDYVRQNTEEFARQYPNFIVRVWPISELLTKYGLR
ncbi:hypothetical protein [Caulobacter radicis]|uniref:hypothetical protein n=1 Tax=Caulobacter radicis TaxID=2172650 RepID=UPI0010576734|nr:hypothetical protein [Caulobacter radicis]